MQGCQATGKSSKSQAGRARTVLRGTSCPQRRPVDQPPHPEGSHTTVVPFYPAPLLTALVFLSTPPWPDTLSRIPAYSPNVNLIERLWKFMRAKALCRWHKTFADMQAAVSEVLDHLEDYRGELQTLMTEKFHIIDKQDIPVEYREVA